jgi:uroporphyrinogen-III decarboxylase
MSEINALLNELNELCDSTENNRRLSLWEPNQGGIRGEVQWHSVPNYSAESGKPMPVTAECLEKVWQDVLGLDLAKYYTDPVYFLEYYLKIRLKKYKEFPDDTPLTRDIPVSFGVTHEAGMLGQEIFLDTGEEPSFAKATIVDENTDFKKPVDFNDNEYLKMVIPYYEKVKALAGSEFNVLFPKWFRGPQGVALYVRGFEELSMDLYLNGDLVHQIMRYVTDAQMKFEKWRSDYLDQPIAKGDLFNDDIPIMSPESYEEFFLPYEQEISDFYGGIFYWHSCGDITRHVSALQKLSGVELFDFGVSMEDKLAGIKNLKKPTAIEFRVFAKPHIQECSEEESKSYVRGILDDCMENKIGKYIIRSSGMSIIFGGNEDMKKLGRWVELVREVQAGGTA